MIGIYEIRNTVNGKVYIGRSLDIYRRWADHKRKLCLGTHYNEHLQRSYNTYGRSSFVYNVIEECSEESLNEREMYWISETQASDPSHGYNLTLGGEGTRATEETRRKMSEASKGRVVSEESRRRMSVAKKGRPALNKGTKHRPESIEKMRASHRGKRVGSKHPRAILTESDIPTIVQRIKSGESIRFIASIYDVNWSTIGNIKRGQNWSHITGGPIEVTRRNAS